MDQLRIRPSQPSLAGTYAELGNKKNNQRGDPRNLFEKSSNGPPFGHVLKNKSKIKNTHLLPE